jgi:O-antigen/teichoic acid export membrane protein
MTRSRDSTSHLTSGRLLARNTIWNLFGQMLPMAVGVVAIPLLIRGMGVARFGILSLAWIVVGYFSLFDLSIGRALTKLVADKLGANEEHSIPPLAWTSLLLMFLLGVIGGLVTFAISPWLVHRLLKIPEALQTETLRGFYLLAVSIPLVTVTSGLRGILEALQRFRMLNLIRIPMSLFSFLGPLLVLPFSHSLVPVIAVLIVGRVVGAAAHLFACFNAIPALGYNCKLDRSIVMPVVKFGGWMTISNIVGPVMVYSDRFVVGSLLSVGAVAYYSAPFDMVSRLWVIPGAMTSVLFPAFAMSVTQNTERTGLLLGRGIKYVLLALFPIVLAVISFAPEGLRLWLGPVFAQNSATALRWLAAGILVNSLAQIPFALIQSAGRPDITSKLHLAELPLYLVAVWLLTRKMGIEGTAIAWSGRVALDAVILCWCARSFFEWSAKSLAILGTTTAAGLLVCYASTLVSNLAIKGGIVSLALLGFGLVGWFLVLAPGERMFLSGIRAKVAPQVERTS